MKTKKFNEKILSFLNKREFLEKKERTATRKEALKKARIMKSEVEGEISRLETKVHNLAYFLIAFITLNRCLLESDIEKIVPLVGLFGNLISLIFWFKVYLYSGKYTIDTNIQAYNSFITRDSMMEAEINALEECIENNKALNKKRNISLDQSKKAFFITFIGELFAFLITMLKLLL